jgi:excisionase family DNA binding protein
MILLGMKDTAKKLGIHPITLSRLAKEGKIPYYKIGHRKKFDTKDIDKYLRGKHYDGAKLIDPFVSL